MDQHAWPNARDFGALGDGLADDAPALQRALEACGGRLYLPAGTYKTGRTLRVPAGTFLWADERATVKAADGAFTRRGEYLLANAGDADICIQGGVWDGNNPGNPRGDMFDPAGTTGTLLNFRGVTGLTLRSMTLRDPECYYIRLCEVRDFRVEDILFDSPHLRPNQDGVHLAGHCERGVIRHLRGTRGSPNDDFVALNADDCFTRQTNFDIIPGPIRDILVDGLQAEACHTFLRLLSVDAEISNIVVRNVRGGFAACAVNMDAARYCRTPIVSPKDPRFALGVGQVRDVRIENMQVYPVGNPQNPALCLETDVDGFEMRHFQMTGERSPILRMRHTGSHILSFQGLQRSASVSTLGCQLMKNGVCHKLPLAEFALERGSFQRLRIERAQNASGMDFANATSAQ